MAPVGPCVDSRESRVAVRLASFPAGSAYPEPLCSAEQASSGALMVADSPPTALPRRAESIETLGR